VPEPVNSVSRPVSASVSPARTEALARLRYFDASVSWPLAKPRVSRSWVWTIDFTLARTTGRWA
jgi:hypothetical protein